MTTNLPFFGHSQTYGKTPKPDRIPSIPVQMTMARVNPRKNRGLILRKVTIPRPTPMSNAGTRVAALIIICASIKPAAERAMREQEQANRKYAARLE